MNERIQQFFVTKMLKIEEEWYRKDDLDIPNISFFDNIGILSQYNTQNVLISKRYKNYVLFDFRFV